ncbi:MAG: hypothetical protein WCF90_04520 [Methanomicrobiales archaeon]
MARHSWVQDFLPALSSPRLSSISSGFCGPLCDLCVFTTVKKINAGEVVFPGKGILFWPVVILYLIMIIVAILFLGIIASGLDSYGYY